MSFKPLTGSHLSPAQLSEWVLGERGAEAVRHVESCPVCRGEIHQFEAAIGGFRGSIREWTEGQLPYRPHMPRSDKRPLFRWALAAAAVLALMLVVQSVRMKIQRPVPATDDAALLTQIDQEISRTVPAAMDPLSALVAGDGARAIQ